MFVDWIVEKKKKEEKKVRKVRKLNRVSVGFSVFNYTHNYIITKLPKWPLLEKVISSFLSLCLPYFI